jgi:O-antigen biosynthesis protein
MTDKLMSIIILNWNRLHYTRQTVETIIAKTTVPHELIFVDNGSKDGTQEYLLDMQTKTNAKNVICQFNNKNLGVAGGRNSGLAKATGDYLVTIDDDILVPDKWDILMANACDKIPSLGITGVNVEPFSFPVQKINGAMVRPKNGNLGGACLCLPKRVFKSIGYYNYFSTYGHEDAAMYYRLAHMGLISAYIEPKGVHLDIDADKSYRVAKNDAHRKGSIQLHALAAYRAELKRTGNAYVPFNPNFEPADLNIFTTDLILNERKK